jgi:hypothetical protein
LTREPGAPVKTSTPNSSGNVTRTRSSTDGVIEYQSVLYALWGGGVMHDDGSVPE